jgi:exodeoxyribonuclease V alpha subunit
VSANDPRGACKVLRERAGVLLDEGLVEDADLRIAAELGRFGGELREDVLLALALVAAAPRRGDVALDLARSVAEPSIGLPPGREWLDAVATSPLVSGPGADAVTPFVLDGALLHSRRAFEQQVRLAAKLRARADAGLADLGGAPVDLEALAEQLRRHFPESRGAALDRQMLAVATGTLRFVSVIAGGPGTGKTFTIRTLLAVLFELAAARGTELRVALTAPTGKAAARITQAIGEELADLRVEDTTRAALASLDARTIHRLLGVDRRAGRPRRATDATLPYDVVVVDEASMVDLTLMCRLLDALHPETRLVLLGDRHQLASVEAGSVLADLVPEGTSGLTSRWTSGFSGALEVALGIPLESDEAASLLGECVVHLERPRRFDASAPVGLLAKGISEGSAQSIERALAVFDESPSPGGPSATLVPHGRAGRLDEPLIARLASGYAPYIDVLEGGPAGRETIEAFHLRVLRALETYRVLCVHRAGPFGAESVARSLGGSLLRGRRRGSRDVDSDWVGKPVLVVRNSYDTGLFNGDVGVVVARDGGRAVAFTAGADSVRYVRPERLPPHELALATTVHKAQGSQFDHVALLLPDVLSAILTREVVYTGVTRARESVTVAGDRAILRAALARPTVRASGLATMLWGSSR